MTFAEFAAEHTIFELHGGPFDGQGVPVASFDCWPSVIRMPRADVGDAVYRMRIGDLVAYDYIGDSFADRKD